MYDADAIEAINFEQLATVTDRILLRGRLPRHRASVPSIADGRAVRVLPATPASRGSQLRLAYAAPARGAATGDARDEKTAHVRRARWLPRFVIAVVFPAVVGVAVGIAIVAL